MANGNKPRRILHFCPLSTGGVATNAHHQATALVEAGADVTLLCSPEWSHAETETNYRQVRKLTAPPKHGQSSRILSRFRTARSILANHRQCVRSIRDGAYANVLFASFTEYLAPVWAPVLRRMSNQGVWFGAMCLDPVRDYVVGPKWWHRWSVKNGYSFLSDAFVHHPIELETFSSRSIEPTVVPHGEYPMPPPSCSSAELKRELGIPDSDNVALCYGHLRDNKNLKTSIEAVAATPGYSLVVAGSEAAPGQIQSSDYVRFAKEIDAESSVFWKIGYQTDQDTSNLFQMSDCILLPYDSSFVSASGVLFIAVPFEVPLIASCGDGPLAAAVQDYGLGIRIPKPTITQVSQALKSVDEVAESARWNDFRHEHSYDRNAELLLDRIAVFHNLQNQE